MRKIVKTIGCAMTIAIAAAAVAACGNGKASEQNPAASAEDAVYENIMTRTSIRAFDGKTVEPEKVDKMLRAGMAATSAVNRQPWHFVVVDDHGVMQNIGAGSFNARIYETATLTIVVCGDMSKIPADQINETWVMDASAATENILLEAHALGLGAVWTAVYPYKDRMDAAVSALGLPENIVPMSSIIMGYPAENPAPKDKWKPENVSYNKFGGKK